MVRVTTSARAVMIAVGLAVAAGCAGGASDADLQQSAGTSDSRPSASDLEPTLEVTSSSAQPPTTTSMIATTTAVPPTTTTVASTTAVSVTPIPTTTATTTITTVPTTTPYLIPVENPENAGWGTTHSGYTATDVFAGCGVGIVSPVNGEVLEVRTVDGWDPAVDNPATRGGRSVAILGDDGVRYYMAHFDGVESTLALGGRVAAGQRLGTVGQTGRASACHVHFALSPPCPGKEWAVRRGVIWPYPYLDAWRRGEALSPVAEIESWLADNPDGCSLAMADPNAGDA